MCAQLGGSVPDADTSQYRTVWEGQTGVRNWDIRLYLILTERNEIIGKNETRIDSRELTIRTSFLYKYFGINFKGMHRKQIMSEVRGMHNFL